MFFSHPENQGARGEKGVVNLTRVAGSRRAGKPFPADFSAASYPRKLCL
jgi:hypothetical protein